MQGSAVFTRRLSGTRHGRDAGADLQKRLVEAGFLMSSGLRTVSIEPTFASFRKRARALLAEGVRPPDVVWQDGDEAGELLPGLGADGQAEARPGASGEAPRMRVPKHFLELAPTAALHAAPDKWDLLYRLLWRMTLGGERDLLFNSTDEDVRRLETLHQNVRRERHKMTAFVRFRKVEGDETGDDDEYYVAWFEPEHNIVELAAPFFRDRFANMRWSILTPKRCVHWDGQRLRFTEGVRREAAPDPDALEELWRSYYRSIFNPARLSLSTMENEMARRYWKNLPEAEIIEELAQESYGRTRGMIELGGSERPHVSAKQPFGAPDGREAPSAQTSREIRELTARLPADEWAKAARTCQACPLFERATQTVFGEGPRDGQLMLIGEQPGDQEDLQGRPFVGPAGQVLDEALRAAGLDRAKAYVTNAVKHFKWKPRGKHRLHQNPARIEISACRPWLEAELSAVQPAVVVLLGASAAQAVLGRKVSVLRERGPIEAPDIAPRVILTVHPSYLLRLREAHQQERETEAFVRDLLLAVDALGRGWAG